MYWELRDLPVKVYIDVEIIWFSEGNMIYKRCFCCVDLHLCYLKPKWVTNTHGDLTTRNGGRTGLYNENILESIHQVDSVLSCDCFYPLVII